MGLGVGEGGLCSKAKQGNSDERTNAKAARVLSTKLCGRASLQASLFASAAVGAAIVS
jgi:hypothetical protein